MKASRWGIILPVKQLQDTTLPCAVLLCLAITLCGCAASSHQLLTWDGDKISIQELTEVLRQNPLSPGQNIRITLLRQTERSSAHVVQVRTAEVPHVHQTHDLIVLVVSGYGKMVLGSETKTVRAGDLIQIPAGVRHYFTNQSLTPSVAVVVFSPAFDGKDTIRTEPQGDQS